MSHDLFMDLSEEQQELISGGGELETLEELDYTNFEYQVVDLQKDIGSGINGSYIRKRLRTNFVFTEAYEDLDLTFEPPTAAYGGNGGNG
ncbi:CTB family bacteriocin [Chroococcidiopsis sp. CCMEE 29]|uniref:CTB family bacteriocin n=1 Tax=Chroococcidiopsis sp. CCMEE 29 TaxID=155894 RepID=UPI002021EA67|nr:CTB family bacteriocin [Chroococcidiopsis sp. CCMEE 29]